MAPVLTSTAGATDPDCLASANSRDFLRSAIDSVIWDGCAVAMVSVVFLVEERSEAVNSNEADVWPRVTTIVLGEYSYAR